MIVALTLCVGALVQADDTAAQRANSLYKQGVIAMNEGKYDIARTTFRVVLRINPKHLPARKKFLFISSNRRSLAIRDRKNALCKVLIPKVHLDKATVRESLDMLAVQVERESQQKITPNFITGRCRAKASRTQETTQLQGTTVTNADEQGIDVGGSPNAAAPGNVEGNGRAVARRPTDDA